MSFELYVFNYFVIILYVIFIHKLAGHLCSNVETQFTYKDTMADDRWDKCGRYLYFYFVLIILSENLISGTEFKNFLIHIKKSSFCISLFKNNPSIFWKFKPNI